MSRLSRKLKIRICWPKLYTYSGSKERIWSVTTLAHWISFAYATRHPDSLRRLVLMEAGVPGVTPESAFGLANAPKVFQFFFNAVPELPELLNPATGEGRKIPRPETARR
jgi:hypothetical protein